MATPRTPDSVKVIEVIEVKAIRGAGTDDDAVRVVTQWYSFDGKLLAEDDPNEFANHVFVGVEDKDGQE
jgi:hypothetical protein